MSGYPITLTDREYDAMLDRIKALEAELAEARKPLEAYLEFWKDRRIAKLEAALEPFRHMRMMFDAERPMADCEITNLIDGTVCTIGYARSAKEANEFDEIFERARAALPSAPSAAGLPNRTPGWADGGPFIFGKDEAT